jgi:hypothetical protein
VGWRTGMFSSLWHIGGSTINSIDYDTQRKIKAYDKRLNIRQVRCCVKGEKKKGGVGVGTEKEKCPRGCEATGTVTRGQPPHN